MYSAQMYFTITEKPSLGRAFWETPDERLLDKKVQVRHAIIAYEAGTCALWLLEEKKRAGSHP